MKTRSDPLNMFGRIVACGVTLVIVLGGCVSAHTRRIATNSFVPNIEIRPFGRVLVAGFVADGAGSHLGLNEETARFLRMELRSKTSLRVIDSEPLDLADLAWSKNRRLPEVGDSRPSDRKQSNDSRDLESDDVLFNDVAFWQRLGEEYSEPLIVTGAISFKSVAPRVDEVGSRTSKVWHPGFRLVLRLVFIDGRTGEVINSALIPQRKAFATAAREGELSIYFRIMDQAMPSIWVALAHWQPNVSRD